MDVNILIHCNDNQQVLCVINKYHSFYNSDFIQTIVNDYHDEQVKFLNVNISSDTVKKCFSNIDLKCHISHELLVFLSLMDDPRIFDIVAHNIKGILENKYGADFNNFVYTLYQEFIDKHMFSNNLVLYNGLFEVFDPLHINNAEMCRYYNGSIFFSVDDTLIRDEHNKRMILPPSDYYSEFYYTPEYTLLLKRSPYAKPLVFDHISQKISIDMKNENDTVYLLLCSTIKINRVVIRRITSIHAGKCECHRDDFFQKTSNEVLLDYECEKWTEIDCISGLQYYVKNHNYIVETCSDTTFDTHTHEVDHYVYKIKMPSGYTSIFMYY